MKQIRVICIAVAMLSMLAGCHPEADAPDMAAPSPSPSLAPQMPSPSPAISAEEQKRMDLYIAAMKGAFGEENGGDGFIAIRMDTLDGLSDMAKAAVLEAFTDLSPHVYDFKDIETDETRFVRDEHGLGGTIDGTVLSIRVEAYDGDHAVIESTSWFGSLGAVFPKYEAAYADGAWRLELISMAIS